MAWREAKRRSFWVLSLLFSADGGEDKDGAEGSDEDGWTGDDWVSEKKADGRPKMGGGEEGRFWAGGGARRGEEESGDGLAGR